MMPIKEALYNAQWRWRQQAVALHYSLRNRKSYLPLSEPEKVLFILTGLLGDSVMSQPAIAAARELWPEAVIKVMAKTHNRELLRADPNIDEFYICDADPFSLRRSGEIRELKKWLAGQEFDMAIILLGDQFAHLLAEAGIPVRVGVKGTLLEPCLTHAYEIGSPREWGTKERLNCLRVLGADITDLPPKLYVDPAAKESAAAKLSELGLSKDEPYIAFHPFGSTKRQWWPIQNIREFLRQAENLTGMRVVLIGGNETKNAEIGEDKLIDTRGLLSIPELLAVINGSEMVITSDSGPYHIAGALRKRIIGLFRHRRPEHATAYEHVKPVFGINEKCEAECNWDKCVATPCRQMENISTERLTFLL